MPSLKRDSPPQAVEALMRIETQADTCWQALRLLAEYPSNVAIWALLVGGIKIVEREQAARGSNTPHFDPMLMTLGRGLTVAVKWVIQHAPPAQMPLETRWTGTLAAAVDEAILAATHYHHFELAFQAFHKDRYVAEVRSPDLARFSADGNERARQVSAFHKSFRPREGTHAVERPVPPPQTPAVHQAFEQALTQCRRTDLYQFTTGDLRPVWHELLPEYRERVRAFARRAEHLSVGDYRLDEFNAFYTALIVMCAAHDLLCFRWSQQCGVYPLESAVMVRAADAWTGSVAELSGIAPEKCRLMLADLTFAPQSIDLHVHPFIPLDATGETLALAPPFPLHSRHEENVLGVCAKRRPGIYSLISGEKENEMSAALRTRGSAHRMEGPINLPNPVPDIDLMVVDEPGSCVVIAELKWVRKPLRPAEGADRDAEVVKGVGQLGDIQAFLAANPSYLSDRNLLPRPFHEYAHVHYLLIARDHWPWVDPQNGIAIAGFDAFASALVRTVSLTDAVTDLLRYEWLPIEGRDFRVQYDRVTVNGVSLESEAYYPTALG